ncbi:unnamed protein product [Pieris macdunnoughi]|uniref:Uncharacterized protein n=1 Tax=Pieris macdunnoughi TaxID=345717 RepID=A0A821SUW9_9NEOP|nr:unnamed protein product [Pieris macdunnoughi]
MRVRKKPDLRIDIPSYPHDYVEMPPETKKLIHEANRTPNDIPYIDEGSPSSPKVHFQVGSPDFTQNQYEFRTSTPEVNYISDSSEIQDTKSEQSSPVLRKPFRKTSTSVPADLQDYGQNAISDNNNARLNGKRFFLLEWNSSHTLFT